MAISFEEFTGKRIDKPSCLKWLTDHRIEVQRYLDNTYCNREDRIFNWRKFINNPVLAKIIVSNFKQSNFEKTNKIYTKILNSAVIISIYGKKGSGKTALAFDIAEKTKQFDPSKKIFVFGTAYEGVLPDYYNIITDPWLVENNSILIYDETMIYANARRTTSNDNMDITQIMAISRHKKCTLIYCSQLTSGVDKNIWRMSDILMFKPLSFSESDDSTTERNEVFIQYINALYPSEINKRECLAFTGDEWIKFENDKPKWWNEEISTSFRQITEEQAIILARRWNHNGMSNKKILLELKLRGHRWEEKELEYFINQ